MEDYTSKLSGKHEVRFVISMDLDDPTMNNDEIKNYLDSMRDSGVDLVYHYGESKTKVEACNANMEGETSDVMMLISDDMVLQQEGYDDIILTDFNNVFPDFDGGIKYNDGFRPIQDPLMTLPVIGGKVFEQWGYFYHPDYTSVYCDNEMTEALIRMKKFAMSPVCISKHEWTNEPFDELHARNENQEMYRIDKEVFDRRKEQNFGVENVTV